MKECNLMNLPHIPRRAVSWIGSIIVALAGLIGTVAAPAHADPANEYTEINWDIAGLQGGGDWAAKNYNKMLEDLHRATGHVRANNVWESTNTPSRVVEVNVRNNGQPMTTLFFWADNLYLVGYHTHNVLYTPNATLDRNDPQFAGWLPALQGILNRRGVRTEQSAVLPWGYRYGNIPGGNNLNELTFTGQTLFAGLFAFSSDAQRRTADWANAFLTTVVATAEALRLARIEVGITNAIRRQEAFQLGLANEESIRSWNDISDWVNQMLQNPNTGPLTNIGPHVPNFLNLAQMYAYYYHLQVKYHR